MQLDQTYFSYREHETKHRKIGIVAKVRTENSDVKIHYECGHGGSRVSQLSEGGGAAFFTALARACWITGYSL